MEYTEIQRFRQWWMLILLGTVSVMLYYGAISQWYTGVPWGDNPMSDLGLLFPVILITLVDWLVLGSALRTRIDSEGVRVRFAPFLWRETLYPWSEIAEANVREYRPIIEYGGWGVRGFGSNRALNISGRFGLQLVSKTGDRLLIGTQQPEKLRDFLVASGLWPCA